MCAELKDEIQVLEGTNKVLRKARDALAWIYVAKYYFPRQDPGAPFELFKQNLHNLELNAECLNNAIETNTAEWEALIQQGGPAGVAEKLRDIKKFATNAMTYLENFSTAEEFEIYFEQGLRDLGGELAGRFWAFNDDD